MPQTAIWQHDLTTVMPGAICTLLQISLVIAAIIGVVIYRIVIVTVFYLIDDPEWVGSNATLFTSITSACINFVIIMILNIVSPTFVKYSVYKHCDS